jgi:hypothetical protein
MKKRFILFLSFIIVFQLSNAQDFNSYFEDASLRFDYFHSGNSKSEWFSHDQIRKEPYWGGSKINLIDTFNFGDYKFEVKNKSDNKLIYSRGYSSLFGEWIYTEEAKKINRTFSESIIIPYPKNEIILTIYKRQKSDNKFIEVYKTEIDPNDIQIKKDLNIRQKAFKIHDSGKPEHKLDIVILAEGYTQIEIQKFMNDATRFKNHLFENQPFDSLQNYINVWAVPLVSNESGTDIPGENIWKETILNSQFYTFDSERYLNSFDNKKIRDAAANAPYDQIYILVNTDKYGGAGIYNFYSTCTSDNEGSEFVFVHEFGHAFAGLGDEYYTSDVAYKDLYNLENEPWQPNITSLKDFDSKWKHLCDSTTPIPTPSDKEYLDKVGAFEGAGYLEKGLYRPVYDCSMKSVVENNYCPVCRRAFYDMLMFYSK